MLANCSNNWLVRIANEYICQLCQLMYHCTASPISIEQKNLAHGGLPELFRESHSKHMLLVLGQLVVKITGLVVHSHIWE